MPGAWHSKRGSCHRFAYDAHGKPTECPRPIVAAGWRRTWNGVWHCVDACERHAHELEGGPVLLAGRQ